jgi:hypothetical protein
MMRKEMTLLQHPVVIKIRSGKRERQKVRKRSSTKKVDLKIGICSTILTDLSNSRRDYVEKKTTSYYGEMLPKLARPK